MPIQNLQSGLLLQDIFTDAVYNTLNITFPEWEMIKQMKVGDNSARSIKSYLNTGFGSTAIQPMDPGQTNRDFPAGQQSSGVELIALTKEIDATIEIERNLYDRAIKNMSAAYTNPLIREVTNKSIAAKRYAALSLYGDGTGVIGRVESVDEDAIGAGTIVVTLDAALVGYAGWFEEGEVYKIFDVTGANQRDSDNEHTRFQVVSKDKATREVTMRIVDANYQTVTGEASTDIVATDAIYKLGQSSIPNLSTVTNYSSASQIWAGLESLSATDGRIVHGVAMEGTLSGTRMDAAGANLNTRLLQRLVSKLKDRNGTDRYQYKKACTGFEALDVLINNSETDRRLQSHRDTVRGTNKYTFAHGNDAIEFTPSSFCPDNRVFLLPEGKEQGKRVLEFHGTDFESVKEPGQKNEFKLKASANGGYSNMIVAYMHARGTLVANNPAAIGVLTNFTNTEEPKCCPEAAAE